MIILKDVKSKEVIKIIIEEVVPVHLQGVDPMIILKNIMSKEVANVLVHLKEVLKIIPWIKEVVPLHLKKAVNYRVQPHLYLNPEQSHI